MGRRGAHRCMVEEEEEEEEE
eukprot:COSAG01_NODE_43852_length_425_cov_1.294479_1_plen_20_part_01